jgi:hypothetical protein
MRRFAPALVCLLAMAPPLMAAPALAKDTPLQILLDGRPLDAAATSGLVHRGKAFINVVRGTKAFNGLLTFGEGARSVSVTVRSQNARFVVGSTDGTLSGKATTFPAAPFTLNGDIYVPLTTFAQLAGVGVSVDTKHAVARLTSPAGT